MTRPALAALRRAMEDAGLAGYLVPGTDPHRDEWVPAYWRRLAWLTGFTGSAGNGAVTACEAALWTDSRYFLQAEAELDPGSFTLERLGERGTPSMSEWFAARLGRGDRVGVDPRLLSCREYETLARELAAAGMKLHPKEENLVDRVWRDRPGPPAAPLWVHLPEYAGEGVEEKLERLRAGLAREGAEACVLTRPDATAWLFNLRGGDLPFTPVFLAYALVTRASAELFVSAEKVTPEVGRRLEGTAVFRRYEAFGSRLSELGASGVKVWIDPGTCSRWVKERLGEKAVLHLAPHPVDALKAVKNETELSGFRAAHLRDGTVLVRLLRWLEEAAPSPALTEGRVAEKLHALRGEDPRYLGPSFEPIVAFRAHGAVVHYTVPPGGGGRIDRSGVLLVDTGAHYLDGTTDTTRTLAVGIPDPVARERYTRVVKAHVRLARQPFPAGTAPWRLEALARAPLWEAGLDFGHGAGHGVGHCLSVHEYPPALSFHNTAAPPLEAGQVLTIEPGYYEEGLFGLRFENVVAVRPAEPLSRRDRPYLAFEPLTLCPVDRKLLDVSLLSPEERAWIDAYHEKVYRCLAPLLDARTAAWLARATAPL